MTDRNETTDKHRNKTKPVPLKFPPWFIKGLETAKAKLPNRTLSEIIIRGTCKTEKIKVPKDHVFKKPAKK